MEHTSPIYQGSSKAEPFLPTLNRVAVVTAKNRGKSPLQIIEEARETAVKTGEKLGMDRGHASGFIAGFEEGKLAGIKESKQELSEEMADQLARFSADLNKVTERLQVEIGRWFEDSEEKMTDLAIVAVRKLLAAELAISRESALEIVKEALQDVTHSRHARIRVNPFDSLILKDHRQELMNAAGSLRDVEFVSDPKIAGGCIIETDGGVVDATLETKLGLLEDSLGRVA
jgi:flagellar biosynthesis/type III secretory pathway protein FliH